MMNFSRPEAFSSTCHVIITINTAECALLQFALFSLFETGSPVSYHVAEVGLELILSCLNLPSLVPGVTGMSHYLRLCYFSFIKVKAVSSKARYSLAGSPYRGRQQMGSKLGSFSCCTTYYKTKKWLRILPSVRARESCEIQYGKIQIFSKSCSDNIYVSKYDVLNGI